MIHRTSHAWQPLSWQEELSSLITDPQELITLLKLDTRDMSNAQKACLSFPLRTTRSFVSKMKPGDWNDPLLKQILPTGEELITHQGYSSDPLNEKACNTQKGVIHKYFGRLLMITTPQCAVNCRYCFRREFDYQDNTLSRSQWQDALAYIASNETIEEVILSGGDPLTASDRQIEWLIDALEDIPHVLRLRIHSRLPIVLPQRITQSLCTIFSKTRLQLIMVTHCNHPNEIDDEVKKAIHALSNQQFTLLNQAVLLAQINDHPSTQIALSKHLFTIGVLPYYLHLLDKVSGAAHFDVSETRARQLHNEMRARLPGYLVPKLVKELPGGYAKETLA